MYRRMQEEKGGLATRCLYCSQLLLSGAESEAELERAETGHICPQRVWNELRQAEAQETSEKQPAK